MKQIPQKYNTHVQREVELSSPELSMMEKVPKQQYDAIWIVPYSYNVNGHDALPILCPLTLIKLCYIK